MDYREKYLKYKKKYLELKKQIGGAEIMTIEDYLRTNFNQQLTNIEQLYLNYDNELENIKYKSIECGAETYDETVSEDCSSEIPHIDKLIQIEEEYQQRIQDFYKHADLRVLGRKFKKEFTQMKKLYEQDLEKLYNSFNTSIIKMEKHYMDIIDEIYTDLKSKIESQYSQELLECFNNFNISFNNKTVKHIEFFYLVYTEKYNIDNLYIRVFSEPLFINMIEYLFPPTSSLQDESPIPNVIKKIIIFEVNNIKYILIGNDNNMTDTDEEDITNFIDTYLDYITELSDMYEIKIQKSIIYKHHNNVPNILIHDETEFGGEVQDQDIIVHHPYVKQDDIIQYNMLEFLIQDAFDDIIEYFNLFSNNSEDYTNLKQTIYKILVEITTKFYSYFLQTIYLLKQEYKLLSVINKIQFLNKYNEDLPKIKNINIIYYEIWHNMPEFSSDSENFTKSFHSYINNIKLTIFSYSYIITDLYDIIGLIKSSKSIIRIGIYDSNNVIRLYERYFRHLDGINNIKIWNNT